MGYTTDFKGRFKLNKPLSPEHRAYLNAFAETRRMKRNAELTAKREDPIREAVGLPVGDDGGYFVGEERHAGHLHADDVIDYNNPPGQISYNEVKNFNKLWAKNQERIEQGLCQPSLWCRWIPNKDGTVIEWDGCEKFYNYIEWLKYLVGHFLSNKPMYRNYSKNK